MLSTVDTRTIARVSVAVVVIHSGIAASASSMRDRIISLQYKYRHGFFDMACARESVWLSVSPMLVAFTSTVIGHFSMESSHVTFAR